MNILNLWLYDNQLTEDPNDFFGMVKSNGKVGNREVAKLIVDDGSEHKEETIYNLLTIGDKMKAKLMAQGYSINTPLCYGRLGVSGVFEGSSAKFDTTKHKVAATFTQGSELRNALNELNVDVLGIAPTGPVIGQVTDSLSGHKDSIITANNVITLNGNRIRVEGDHEDIGLWFVNVTDSTRTKVTQLVKNDPKQVIAMVPALTAGEYELEIITQFAGGRKLLKEPRQSTFEHVLTVE
ncbi:DNA-binding domain-containing protein [Carboxylicivirga marina]|uniref:DUF4469 domain-containing protein n=1 Tax=Carboxylicivirga marina TaxID=2800988 RepID=A0ABS1HEV6_9BACT|nr:DNA-binding domain-containing protein [Carboxylicivirga marina]MBK3516161.1 DUF4469 domain-containing protein [Carboxylicivirga marina]